MSTHFQVNIYVVFVENELNFTLQLDRYKSLPGTVLAQYNK